MKSLKMALVALILTGLFGTHANARGHASDGLFIETVDSGVMGYPVRNNEMDRDMYGRDHYRHDYRANEVCREIVEIVRGRHGRYREEVRTICRARDDWHRPHNHGHYSNDRYGRNDRW